MAPRCRLQGRQPGATFHRCFAPLFPGRGAVAGMSPWHSLQPAYDPSSPKPCPFFEANAKGFLALSPPPGLEKPASSCGLLVQGDSTITTILAGADQSMMSGCRAVVVISAGNFNWWTRSAASCHSPPSDRSDCSLPVHNCAFPFAR